MKMKNETQALHLARMMQRHIHTPSYELALPSVMVQSKKLKKLSVDDVLLTGFDRYELFLIDSDTICANIKLNQMENTSRIEITKLMQETIEQSDSKKYEVLNISFGTVQSQVLELGHTIDITHIDLEKVTLVSKAKMIAEGSLVIVDDEIAIQIKKVK
jgi:hypothetical protein